MLAAVADSPGPLAEVLSLRDADGPATPGTGEVVVRMLASTVNPSDEVTVSGAYGSRTSFPMVPGFEGVGVIDAAGPGVPAAAVGGVSCRWGPPGPGSSTSDSTTPGVFRCRTTFPTRSPASPTSTP